MKVNVAEMATANLDLDKLETMRGIGVSLESVAPILLACEDLFKRVERAKTRDQQIQPTAVRLGIAFLKAVVRELGAPIPGKE